MASHSQRLTEVQTFIASGVRNTTRPLASGVKQARTPENIGGLRLSHRRSYYSMIPKERTSLSRWLLGSRSSDRLVCPTSYVSLYALNSEAQPLSQPPWSHAKSISDRNDKNPYTALFSAAAAIIKTIQVLSRRDFTTSDIGQLQVRKKWGSNKQISNWGVQLQNVPGQCNAAGYANLHEPNHSRENIGRGSCW